MTAPRKGVEVDLKELGCPYSAEDERTLVWIDGYRKGQSDGMDAGARVVSEVYEKALSR